MLGFSTKYDRFPSLLHSLERVLLGGERERSAGGALEMENLPALYDGREGAVLVVFWVAALKTKVGGRVGVREGKVNVSIAFWSI